MALRIKEIIKEKGTTVKDLAQKMGISNVGLSQHINGNPSVEVLERIANALGVDVPELFTSKTKEGNVLNLTYQIRVGNRFLNFGGGNVVAIKYTPDTTYVELTSGLFKVEQLVPISLDRPLFEALGFTETIVKPSEVKYNIGNIDINRIIDAQGIHNYIRKATWQENGYEIKYLHELQNWYCLLAGKELNVKML